MQAVLAAVIAAVTSVVVTLVSYLLASRQRRRGEEQGLRRRVNNEYLDPLRFQLTETHFRLAEIVYRVEAEGGRCEALLPVKEPDEVSDKDPTWFAGRGCYLISSAYLTACMFAQLKRVREDFPQLRLGPGDDTRLAGLILRVHRGFLADGGVFYVNQPSIGEDLWLRAEGRLRTYREFCELLGDPQTRPWFDSLIAFYLQTGTGEKERRAREVLTPISELSEFIDSSVAGAASVSSRWEAEGLLRRASGSRKRSH